MRLCLNYIVIFTLLTSLISYQYVDLYILKTLRAGGKQACGCRSVMRRISAGLFTADSQETFDVLIVYDGCDQVYNGYSRTARDVIMTTSCVSFCAELWLVSWLVGGIVACRRWMRSCSTATLALSTSSPATGCTRCEVRSLHSLSLYVCLSVYLSVSELIRWAGNIRLLAEILIIICSLLITDCHWSISFC